MDDLDDLEDMDDLDEMEDIDDLEGSEDMEGVKTVTRKLGNQGRIPNLSEFPAVIR